MIQKTYKCINVCFTMKDVETIFNKINEVEYNKKGKIVAIEPESGEYFIGDNIVDAYRKAVERYPGKRFIFKRVGFEHTYFTGALA